MLSTPLRLKLASDTCSEYIRFCVVKHHDDTFSYNHWDTLANWESFAEDYGFDEDDQEQKDEFISTCDQLRVEIKDDLKKGLTLEELYESAFKYAEQMAYI